MLGKLPVPGHPTDLNYSRTRTYCTCRRCGCGFSYRFSDIFHLMEICKKKCVYPFETQHFCLTMERAKVKEKSGSAMHLTLTLTLERS